MISPLNNSYTQEATNFSCLLLWMHAIYLTFLCTKNKESVRSGCTRLLGKIRISGITDGRETSVKLISTLRLRFFTWKKTLRKKSLDGRDLITSGFCPMSLVGLWLLLVRLLVLGGSWGSLLRQWMEKIRRKREMETGVINILSNTITAWIYYCCKYKIQFCEIEDLENNINIILLGLEITGENFMLNTWVMICNTLTHLSHSSDLNNLNYCLLAILYKITLTSMTLDHMLLTPPWKTAL